MIEQFLAQFKEEKRGQVKKYLLLLGIDMARKLGSPNTKQLYQTLKQLSRNIENQENGSNELRSEIKKIQYQLMQLNQHFSRNLSSSSVQNRFQTQHDQEEHKSSKLTAKITESPPPPICFGSITKYPVKPHLDDHQIKQLLYSDGSPKNYKYTLNLQESQNTNRDVKDHRSVKKSRREESSKSKAKLPSYLQGVESKIKTLLVQDKQAHKQQKQSNNQDQYKYQQQTADFQNKKVIAASAETDTYYDIQQYLKSQNNFDFSPVQEMKSEHSTNPKKKSYEHKSKTNSNDNKKFKNKTAFYESHAEPVLKLASPVQVSDFQKPIDSDSMSNFTPPNKEVREFFQKQFQY